MPTEDWELEFSPNFNTNTCTECEQVHIAEASVTQTLWFGDVEITLTFCSDYCRHTYYLVKLREWM
jgi:hypothetical protein